MSIIDGYDVDGEFRRYVKWVEGGYEVDGEFRKDVPWACYCTECEVMLDAFKRDIHDCESYCIECEEQYTMDEFEQYHVACNQEHQKPEDE